MPLLNNCGANCHQQILSSGSVLCITRQAEVNAPSVSLRFFSGLGGIKHLKAYASQLKTLDESSPQPRGRRENPSLVKEAGFCNVEAFD